MFALPPRAELLLAPDGVAAAVSRVAKAVNAALSGSPERPLAIVVMRGGLIFAGHLLPQLGFPVDVDYVDATRYGVATRGGELAWRGGIPNSVSGRTVLLIDDILDSGLTLDCTRAHAKKLGARTVQICVLLSKKRKRVHAVKARWVGFSIKDEFVVGYGLDLDQRYRALPSIRTLPEGV